MFTIDCDPIACEVCERWLDLNKYPTRWHQFHNICGECDTE